MKFSRKVHNKFCVTSDMKPFLQEFISTHVHVVMQLDIRVNENLSMFVAGLQLKVRNNFFYFLFLNQNICCGYSKERSQ